MSTDDCTPSLTCTKCGRVLPATPEFFYRKRSRPTGLRSECKPCTGAVIRKWQEANPEKCRELGRKNDAKRYPSRLTWRRAYEAATRDRIRARQRLWSAANRDRCHTYCRNRKAARRNNGGKHTAADVQAQYERQKGRCFYCSAKLGTYHIDHVTPLSKGGSNGSENLVIACPTCNMRKHTAHPMDFCGRLL